MNKDGRFKSMIDEESKKESSMARTPRRQLGAARWIADGIELEHSMLVPSNGYVFVSHWFP